MNKAFLKEPDPSDEQRCPKCESLAKAVSHETLAAQIRPEMQSHIADTGFFCAYPSCDVAFFDQFGRTVLTDALKRSVYPKDRTAPICACFGLTRDDIEADVREGVATRCRALLEKAKSPEARCAVRAADGQSCVPEVQRYFMKLRQAVQNQ